MLINDQEAFTGMRIVSTVPSATEIVCALGLLDSLVGVSYGCDYPPEVRGKPAVVESTLPRGLGSREIHELVSKAKREGRSYFRIRYDLISELNPDLLIFQGVCDVCGVHPSIVNPSFLHTHKLFKTLTLGGGDIRGVMDDIVKVGKATERVYEAKGLTEKIAGRIDEVREAAERNSRGGRRAPKVLFLEWLDPPITAGHWVPEMIKIAGGLPVLAEEGQPSKVIEWRSILDADPDCIILGPCGFHVVDTLRELESITPTEGWRGIKAVKEGQVYVVESSHYFSRPGPRVVHGVEMLSDILWGTSFFSDSINRETVALADPWVR